MPPSTDRYYDTFTARFWLGDLDLRPLGFMRLVFGGALLWSMADLAPVLFAFFSDDGVAPRWALLDRLVRANRFCLWDIAGPHWVLVALYVLMLLSIVCFTIGWHSRLASVTTYLLVCGIHERNLLVFDGSDNVLRVLLFWMMFMPTGARYSVDAVLRGARGEPTVTHAPALPMRLGQLNIAWVYLNTVIYKWPGVEWHNGTALRIALGLDHLFARTLGHVFFDQRWFVWLGTHGTVLVETCFLPLFFLPLTRPATGPLSQWPKWVFQPTWKALAIAGGTAMHLGIAVLMSVGNFSYIMIAAYFLLYEPEWVAWLVRQFDRHRLWGEGRSRVLYDGACRRCTRFARALQGFDAYQRLELIDFRLRQPLPADLDLETSADRLFLIRSDGARLSDWAALRELMPRVPALLLPGLICRLPGIDGLGATLFRGFWRHSPHAPLREPRAAWLPASWRQRGRQVLFAALAFLMVFTLWFSFPEKATIPALAFGGKSYTHEYDVAPSHMPHHIFELIQELELWQKWDMFSPRPLDHDVYLMGRGQLKNGTEVDVLRGDRGNGGAPLLPPVELSFFFTRWTKYINNILYEGDNSPWTLELGRYICRQWNNNRPPDRPELNTFKLFREERRVAMFDEAKPDDWHEVTIWDHHCF